MLKPVKSADFYPFLTFLFQRVFRHVRPGPMCSPPKMMAPINGLNVRNRPKIEMFIYTLKGDFEGIGKLGSFAGRLG